MRRLIVAALALCLAIPAVAQDQYATGYRMQIDEKWKPRVAAFQEQVQIFYFAVGCQVINEAMAGRWISPVGQAMTREAARDGKLLWFPVRPFMEAGMAMAKARGCQFWHDNPDAVFELRQTIP